MSFAVVMGELKIIAMDIYVVHFGSKKKPISDSFKDLFDLKKIRGYMNIVIHQIVDKDWIYGTVSFRKLDDAENFCKFLKHGGIARGSLRIEKKEVELEE